MFTDISSCTKQSAKNRFTISPLNISTLINYWSADFIPYKTTKGLKKKKGTKRLTCTIWPTKRGIIIKLYRATSLQIERRHKIYIWHKISEGSIVDRPQVFSGGTVSTITRGSHCRHCLVHISCIHHHTHQHHWRDA